VEKGSEEIYYVYDAAGQRVRKVVEKNNNGTLIEERIYLGGFEIFRRSNGSGIKLERETLHIMDDQQRIALVETRTKGDDDSPEQLVRYQFGNHLGSSSLELDEDARVISYEEYYPYGSSSYQAVDKDIKAAAKRYRYTGKERDDETGLYYYGARYYAAWLGRWVSCDPSEMIDGPNVYLYVANNPIGFTDFEGTQMSDPETEEILQQTRRMERGEPVKSKPDIVKKIRELETTVKSPKARFFPLTQYWYSGGEGGPYKLYFGEGSPFLQRGREEEVWYHPFSELEVKEMARLKEEGVSFYEREMFPEWITKMYPELIEGRINFFNRRQIQKFYASQWVAESKKRIQAMVMSWSGAAQIGYIAVFALPGLVPKPSMAPIAGESTITGRSPAPILGKAQSTGPGHAATSIRAARELARQPDAVKAFLQRAYSTMAGKSVSRRIPDAGLRSRTGITAVEVLSKSDWRSIKTILEVIKRNLKAMLKLAPEEREGLFIIWPKG
jgi:RHS repeat-associated protein